MVLLLKGGAGDSLAVALDRRLHRRLNVHVHEHPDPLIDRRTTRPIHTARDTQAAQNVNDLCSNVGLLSSLTFW